MAEKSDDCYIDVWRDADFRGETIRIKGPAEYPSLGLGQGDWGDDIGSLRVGPNAFVMAFRHRDFQDEMITFGPNEEVADLGHLKFDKDISSMRLIDSLKIFNRVGYNSALTTDTVAPDAPDAPEGGKERPNPHKGKHWKGRKR